MEGDDTASGTGCAAAGAAARGEYVGPTPEEQPAYTDPEGCALLARLLQMDNIIEGLHALHDDTAEFATTVTRAMLLEADGRVAQNMVSVARDAWAVVNSIAGDADYSVAVRNRHISTMPMRLQRVYNHGDASAYIAQYSSSRGSSDEST